MHAKVKPKTLRKRTRPSPSRGAAMARRRAVWETPAFLAAIDASPDLIFITDPETVRFLYVNETACRMHGYTRAEYLKMSPMAVLGVEREELTRVYREIIATGDENNTIEFFGVSKDGSRHGWFEAHRRAVRLEDRWVIVTITRDITRRRRAEKNLQRLGRMYATLSATNEVILRATSPAELYQGVCDAAVHSGKFVNAHVVIPEADSRFAKVVAAAGDQRLHKAQISVEAEIPGGQDPVEIAFRTRTPSVCNNLLRDECTRPWHAKAQALDIAAIAAVPLLRGDRASGVLVFHSSDKRAFDEEVVGLFERMAQNITFALDNFEREAQRREALSRERFTRLYTALSATNEAIMRAASPGELFQQMCDAAVNAGKFCSTSVYQVNPASEWLTFAAGTGSGIDAMRALRISVDADKPEGCGLIGTAVRTGEPCICNNLDTNPNMPFWAGARSQTRANAGAAFPICRGGNVVGAISFYAFEYDAFDEGIVSLLARMSANVSFALDNLDREAERRRAEQATVRLQRMYAALSATNEAILRARTAEQLYRLVCDAVAARGGRFITALLYLAQPGSHWMKLAALSSKTDIDSVRNYRVSIDPAYPEGRGLTGEAFRSQQPRTCNDYLNDERARAWREEIAKTRVRAVASIPVLRGGRSIGVLAMYARETDSFDEETVKLLQRITANLAFALDTLDREDERRHAEEALRDSEARFRALTELSSDWYWELDADLRFSRIEGRAAVVDPVMSEHNLGKRPWDLELDVDGGWDTHRATLQSRQPFRDFLHYRPLADGGRCYYTANGEPIFDAAGRFVGYRGVARDVTAQVLAEQRIQYMATHDSLTELPNRPMFSQMLSHAIESARRYRRRFAVLFIDLDRFKFINDTLGHEAGDILLQEMARRLTHTLRASDIIARFGGDEFVVLLPEINDATEVAGVANKILAALVQPVRVADQECRVTASIGISTFPDDAQDEQSLMKNADMAMYLAKAEGKNNYQFYSQEIRTEARERLVLENNLRRALDDKEFFLHFQPKVDLRTGAITGVEALLRWHNSELGSVPPAKFIPLAEETGLIVPIGRWVLRSACGQGVAWQQQGLPGIRVAVNLSARQFSDENLIPDISAALADSGLSPSLLELEITEGMVMQNPERTVQKLDRIREMGVRLAIDDFGTGYSSLAQLKRFPIDTLKVDRSFISDIPNDAEDVAITQAIIAMGKSLDLVVVAEGVETQEQMQFLREHQCDQMQGYFFSKPVGAEQLATLLRRHDTSCDVAIPSDTARRHGAADEK